jgi:hypothetical protein
LLNGLQSQFQKNPNSLPIPKKTHNEETCRHSLLNGGIIFCLKEEEEEDQKKKNKFSTTLTHHLKRSTTNYHGRNKATHPSRRPVMKSKPTFL